MLPVLTLLAATLTGSTRMVRAGTVETLRSDYVQMARLNGFPERTVVVRYALRNALAPAVQVFAQFIQYLVGGIIIVEYLFAYPGLGKELVDAVAIRDVREVQSIAILIAAFYILINILADLLVVLLVPKLQDRECVSGCASRAPAPGIVGLVLLALVVGIAIFGPFLAPHPLDEPVGSPFEGPSAARAPRHRLPRSRRPLARCSGAGAACSCWRDRDAARLRRRPRRSGWSPATRARCSTRC